MASDEPEFIDLYGIADDGAGWKRCWHGREPLWKVFWGYVVFGHGVVLGSSLGVMVIAMVLSFAADPGSLDAGLTGLSVGMALLVAAVLAYGLFTMTALWRCAPNTPQWGWTLAARGLVVTYGGAVLWLVVRSL